MPKILPLFPSPIEKKATMVYFKRLKEISVSLPGGAGARGKRKKDDDMAAQEEYVHFLDIRKDFPAGSFPVEPVPERAWRNGLVVRMPNHLGDAVMALPALSVLRKIVPEICALYVIAPRSQQPLYGSLPIVDGVVELKQSHRLWRWREFRRLRQLRFGVGVLFNNSFRDALLMRLAGVGTLYGAAARWRSLLLKRAFRFPARPKRKLALSHQANKLLAMARAMGAPEWDGKMPVFRLRPAVDELRPGITAICDHPKLMTIASGAAYGAAKRWPSENFRQVAEAWIARGGIVAVLGAGSERIIGTEVVAGLSGQKAFNLCGRTQLADLMHLLKSSVVTVANDSGVMHLAAALGTPGVAVFGPTDYTATGPIASNWRLLYRKIECAPCFRRECPRGENRCIRQITPEMVIAEVDDLLINSR